MENSFAGRFVAKIAIAIFIIATLDLVFVNWWILKSNKRDLGSVGTEISSSKTADADGVSDKASATPAATPVVSDIQTENKDAAIRQSPSPTAQPAAIQTVVQTANREIFIPMGTGQSKSDTFADIGGTEVTIDSSKYSPIDYVVFEASIWVDGGNGRAWAQIKNVNDNNPLIESQISNVTSTATSRTSGKIPIPSGSKTYIVQAKTDMTDFAAHIGNARLKIVLK